MRRRAPGSAPVPRPRRHCDDGSASSSPLPATASAVRSAGSGRFGCGGGGRLAAGPAGSASFALLAAVFLGGFGALDQFADVFRLAFRIGDAQRGVDALRRRHLPEQRVAARHRLPRGARARPRAPVAPPLPRFSWRRSASASASSRAISPVSARSLGAQRRVGFPHQRLGAQPLDQRHIGGAAGRGGLRARCTRPRAVAPARRGFRPDRGGWHRRRCRAGRFRAGSRQAPARAPASDAPRRSLPGAPRRAVRRPMQARWPLPAHRPSPASFPAPRVFAGSAALVAPDRAGGAGSAFRRLAAMAGAPNSRASSRRVRRRAPERQPCSAPPRPQPATPCRRRRGPREASAGKPHSAARL